MGGRVSGLQLGVYLGPQGAAALFNGHAIIASATEGLLPSAESARAPFIGPGGEPHGEGPLYLGPLSPPREAIRSCLRSAGVSWRELSGVTVVGPDGAKERLIAEYEQHVGFSELKSIKTTRAQRALSQLSLYEHGLSEGISLVLSPELVRRELRGYGVFQSRAGLTQLLHHHKRPEHLASLQSPTIVYRALIERARAQLKLPPQADHHPLAWASQLAATSRHPLPQLKRWFSARPQSLELELSSYDMWLELLCLERRALQDSAKVSASREQLRQLWAALLSKAQSELVEALCVIALSAQRSAPELPLVLSGELAHCPELFEALARAPLSLKPLCSLRSTPLDIAIGASLIGAQSSAPHAQRYELRSALSPVAQPELQERAISQLRPPLVAVECEVIELGRRLARAVLKGGVVAHASDAGLISEGLQGAQLCLTDPSASRATQQLNATLERPREAPTYLICPSDFALSAFEGLEASGSSGLRLLRPSIDYIEHLRPSLRPDGLCLTLLMSPELQPQLCELCEALTLHFNRPPILLAAPLTLAPGQLTRHPADALYALSARGLDALIMGQHWVESSGPARRRELRFERGERELESASLVSDHLGELSAELSALDQLIFDPERVSVDWDEETLQRLSLSLAPQREASRLFSRHPLLGPLDDERQAHALGGLHISLNPRGLTRVSDERGRWSARLYPWAEAVALVSLCCDRRLQEARQAQLLHLPPREREALINWGLAELESLGVSPHQSWRVVTRASAANPQLRAELLLGAFQDPQADLRSTLKPLWAALKRAGYTERVIAPLRGDASLRALSDQPSDLLARLFWLGEPLSRAQLIETLGEEVMTTLIELKVLTGKESLSSQLQLDCVAGLYLASDSPLQRGGAHGERYVRALNAQERGLVRLALTKREGRSLDLSETLGAVAAAQARIPRSIELVVRDPRAARFTLFNLQLNGVERVSLERSDHLSPSAPQLYDQIFARSDDSLQSAGAYLKPKGRIFLMSRDLGATARAPSSVLHRALGLALCDQSCELSDPRLYEGFEGHAGYWVIEQLDSLELERSAGALSGAQRARLHRPLSGPPCERLHEYVEHYFAPHMNPHELSYPHPELSLLKESHAGGQKRFSASNLRWSSLAPLRIGDEVYAQLKALMIQRQGAPVASMSAALVRLGLKVVKGQLS